MSIGALLALFALATDAGASDPFGVTRGERPKLAPSPTVRIESSLPSSLTLDAGYSGGAMPSVIALPTLHMHVFASEELGPDALRRLTRANVTLWLDTKSNMLRESTLDVLRAAKGNSYVKLKAPLVAAHQARFATLRSGVWVDAADLSKLSLHWIGTRPLTVEVNGEGDSALWEAVKKAKPHFVFWAKPSCSKESWVAAKALGSSVLTVDAAPCAHSGPPVLPSYRGMAPSTERTPFIWIRPDAAPAQVRDLYVRNAACLLLVSVGERAADVRKLSALLDALERKQ